MWTSDYQSQAVEGGVSQQDHLEAEEEENLTDRLARTENLCSPVITRKKTTFV